MKLFVSCEADDDLTEITRYTRHNWGDRQARNYVGGLIELIEGLPKQPDHGRSVDSVPVPYLRIKYKSHFVFYRILDDAILVVRVLHCQMDFTRHLN
jgi:toxin ParE1/3/4